jgi:hypothetical protein
LATHVRRVLRLIKVGPLVAPKRWAVALPLMLVAAVALAVLWPSDPLSPYNPSQAFRLTSAAAKRAAQSCLRTHQGSGVCWASFEFLPSGAVARAYRGVGSCPDWSLQFEKCTFERLGKLEIGPFLPPDGSGPNRKLTIMVDVKSRDDVRVE